MKLVTVILAAGQGTRMRSGKPKVLHTLAAKPMVEHVLDTAARLSDEPPVVVYGHGGEQMQKALMHRSVRWAHQAEQRGTGHAVMQALPALEQADTVLILYGDVPLLDATTLQRLIARADDTALALLTVKLPDPTGYGRIVRDTHGAIVRIVEHKDATAEERGIDEINTGIMVVQGDALRRWLPLLTTNNAQGEYYLTDIIALAVADGVAVGAEHPADPVEVTGVNDRTQLAELERHFQMRQVRALMAAGVGFRDPARFDLRGSLSCGRDVVFDVNVIVEGSVTIGDDVRIGPNTYIRDANIASGTEIAPNCVIEEATIGGASRIGPFARIRPGTVLADDVHIGNFVEIKNSNIGHASKVNHLSYVGDSEVGADVNVGAGTITCNYDGANKHKTIIQDNVHIGSDTQLVAPVTVGRGATIAAGTTVMRDVNPDTLVLNTKQQREIRQWQRPQKAPKKD
ncbi:MAG: bifunctional UDP-N-acetylglucosamine diphosphorylase/glucosamine-1-phosphate N-acetyltransferase GlmU [Gammaproteobacteria bacterium]|nr:bifunctional UDP-N-acetylglucosamine diphosphorylase/glucosamine-1-phosphate N-acetyltransferase GlmU [Gammaproteobacteria bacterium]